jgi:hypothetical protein
MPWHYAHHMGDQDKNFGVSWSWFDSLAGTRGSSVASASAAITQARGACADGLGRPRCAQRRNPLRRLLGARRV